MPTYAEQYAVLMAFEDEPKLCITPDCDQERMIKRDGMSYISLHCRDHQNQSGNDPSLKCGIGCGVERRKSPRGTNQGSYCHLHARMVDQLGAVEAKEWYQHGKLLVPSGTRRDARSGDGFLYVLFQPVTGLVVFGIAASRKLVESRTRTHERSYSGLEQLEIISRSRGGAFTLESRLKLILRRNDHFPYVPMGTHKWTETVAYHDFMPLYLKLTEPGCLLD